MKGSEFVFDYVHLMHYKCHKINPSCGGSYINSPDWIKNKKAIINPINKKDNKCYEEIKKDPQSITKIKPFIIKSNCKVINFPSEKDDWEKILMFCMLKKKKYILLMYAYQKPRKTSYSFNDFKGRNTRG